MCAESVIVQRIDRFSVVIRKYQNSYCVILKLRLLWLNLEFQWVIWCMAIEDIVNVWMFICFPSSMLPRPHRKTIVQLQTIRWDQKALFGVCQCARWLSEKNAIIQEVFCLEYFFCEKRHLSMDLFVPCVHFYNAAIHFIRNNIQKFYRMHLLFFCKIVWSIQMVEFNFEQPFFFFHSFFSLH